MDVLSIESCVQAVIGAYRDASKLVQRLKDKQNGSQGFILPNHLTKEFEDSLSLGCLTVQSQYDHDVRRFGETYARGDSIAREQMKDILITLQQAVLSNLREVFMDEASLDLHSLKETSDDSRVNATVCLGQLYQRMSTASAVMKQISRPYLDELDKVQLPNSLAYSSSHSTHSSFGGRPFDNQSATSYTTDSSRTAIAHDSKPSSGPTSQRRISMNSSLSYPNEREQPKSRTPGEDNVPALPPSMQRQISQGAVEAAWNPGSGGFQQTKDHLPSFIAGAPPPYKPGASGLLYTTDDKGQNFPRESSFYQSPIADVQNVQQRYPPQRSPGPANETMISPEEQVHELDNGSRPDLPSDQESTTLTSAARIPRQQRVPLNPDYSTLEYIAIGEVQGRPPETVTSMQQHRQHMQQMNTQAQQYFSQVNQTPDAVQRQPFHTQSATRPPTSSGGIEPTSALVGPLLQIRVPTIPAAPRPLSIRSTGSTGSKIGAYALRKALPPGIAEAIQKPSPSPLDAQLNNQPRYVKPTPLDLRNSHVTQVISPTSPIAQQVDRISDIPTTSASSSPSLESTMRVPVSPQLQVPRSDLNLPSESNLAGFCKGAVRQQLGTRKKGFSLEHKRGAKGQEYFFRCTKCNFEGPAAVSTALPSGGRGAVKKEKSFDSQVRVSSGGIKYRWAFLAKCHVFNKGTHSDATNSNDVFGCYFCCAEGAAKGWMDQGVNAQLATLGTFENQKATANVTPTFEGLDVFLEHLETHRLPARTPGLIVANELNCIVGRVARDSEDFDLNLPPLRG